MALSCRLASFPLVAESLDRLISSVKTVPKIYISFLIVFQPPDEVLKTMGSPACFPRTL